MKAQIDRIRTVLERHQRDPRVKLFGVGELVADLRQVFSDLAEIETAHLEREKTHAELAGRVASLERQLAGLGALRVNPIGGGR